MNVPCFALCAAVCDFMDEAECVPASDGDSERERFVGDCTLSEKSAEMYAEIVGKGGSESNHQPAFLYFRFCYFFERIISLTLPFDFLQDKGTTSVDRRRPFHNSPQSGLFQDFAGFRKPIFDRSLRCTLRAIFAVGDAPHAAQIPMVTGFHRCSHRSRFGFSPFPNTRKSVFAEKTNYGAKRAYPALL